MRRSMPWFMYPKITCRVLNKLSMRVDTYDLITVRNLMDTATQQIWEKIEMYNKEVVNERNDLGTSC